MSIYVPTFILINMHINSTFFKNIDSEVKAYFLGLFAADGCNYVTGSNCRCFISLQEKDKQILERLNIEIFPDKNRSLIYKKSYGNSSPQYKFETFDKQISQDLIHHGIIPRKSLILKFPTTVPKHLIFHFIRGYFDGDGYIGTEGKGIRELKKYRITILSTKHFLNSLTNYLSSNIKWKIYKTGKIYRLCIRGNNQVRNFCQFIYQNSTIYLDRKYRKYLELMSLLNKRKLSTSSKYRGISYSKKMKKWLAYFSKRNMPQLKVGWFNSEEEAFKARNNYLLPNDYSDLEYTKQKLSYEN